MLFGTLDGLWMDVRWGMGEGWMEAGAASDRQDSGTMTLALNSDARRKILTWANGTGVSGNTGV